MRKYIYPSLKPLVEYYTDSRKITFFSRPGIAIEMDDDSGFISATCKLIDGTKDFVELKNTLLPQFPKETAYLNDLLMTLDDEYLLEDKSINDIGKLTEHDITRWSRNI